FKDNLVYKATLRHYISTLVDEKASFMWAIEGTRSRTGKLVWPQMGILKYIMEGEQASKETVKYVPVSVVYDLIPDVMEMTAEGRGKEKKAESLTWMLDYIRKMGSKRGKISVRFGEPVEPSDVAIGKSEALEKPDLLKKSIPRFAFELVRNINQITPVTTTSLLCVTLLSKFSLSKRALETYVAALMEFVESHHPHALIDRGRPIGESVQAALNLLTKEKLFLLQGEGANAKYTIAKQHYLPNIYYANMAVHHFYHRSFIELALMHLIEAGGERREMVFWEKVMSLRDLFKFEFFYSNRSNFTNEIEADLGYMDKDWASYFFKKETDLMDMVHQRKMLVAPVVLFNYIEAYQVVAQALLQWDTTQAFDEKIFADFCFAIGEEMEWQGQIRRIEAVSKPFLKNGIRLAKHRGLIPSASNPNVEAISAFLEELNQLSHYILALQKTTAASTAKVIMEAAPIERSIVPGSRTESVTRPIVEGESGAHIGAFFDLDRTLISGYSATEFFRSRILSRQMSPKEAVAQFLGVLVYAMGNRDFSGLISVSTRGISGMEEQRFIDVGEEVYLKHLAHTIYPESRALVAAHLAKGHTVAIISAATPYQVNPIARDLGVEHVMCTRVEVKNGRFTGKMIEPTCWGDGKAYYAQQLAGEHKLDLNKSYFYTDSIEDLPLLESVGHPRPMNPDAKLAALAFKRGWSVDHFGTKPKAGLASVFRTALSTGTIVPAVVSGLAKSAVTLSRTSGVNSMTAVFGDLATSIAGISLAVKGEEHLENRPAVFILNHQSSADMLIVAKLVRRDIVGVAKKELRNHPLIGPMLIAGGTIFLDRGNREKAVEALKPAADVLKKGKSIMIFPEGTRSKDYTLGKFKKGAFRIAMDGGVPLIPIVIKNAYDAMPKGAMVFRPAVVKITVLPPIPTTDWNLENLGERIEGVRNLFLEELGQKE
ncbi:MAG: HAD-IB family hydrolase, partial [Chitinophagales bacterium]